MTRKWEQGERKRARRKEKKGKEEERIDIQKRNPKEGI